MTDWTDSHLLARQAAAYQKLTLVFVGICFYDFVNTIHFDWMLLTGTESKRRWTLASSVKWLYLACRYCNLATGVTLTILTTLRGGVHCSTLMRVFNIFGVMTVSFGTIILFVRVGAIWEWDKRIVAAFIVTFPINVALGIRSMVKIHSTRINTAMGPICDMSGVSIDVPNVVALLLVDIGVLVLLFLGLRRWKDLQGVRIWQLLRDQGLVYLTLAVALEVPMMVFLILNYNEYMDMFFTTPDVILLPIATTQFYRSLTSFSRRRDGYEYRSTYTQPPGLSRVPPGFRVSVDSSLDPI